MPFEDTSVIFPGAQWNYKELHCRWPSAHVIFSILQSLGVWIATLKMTVKHSRVVFNKIKCSIARIC